MRTGRLLGCLGGLLLLLLGSVRKPKDDHDPKRW